MRTPERAGEGEETGPAPESSESRHSRVERGTEEPLKEAKSEWAESQRGDHTKDAPTGKGRWSLRVKPELDRQSA